MLMFTCLCNMYNVVYIHADICISFCVIMVDVFLYHYYCMPLSCGVLLAAFILLCGGKIVG